MKNVIIKFAALLCVCAAFKSVPAQTIDELVAKFPNDYAVILNRTEDLRLFVKDGKPQGERKITVELVALDDKANGTYNRYIIYHGSFDKISDLEAYSKVP